jgi:hypothetical protein
MEFLLCDDDVRTENVDPHIIQPALEETRRRATAGIEKWLRPLVTDVAVLIR